MHCAMRRIYNIGGFIILKQYIILHSGQWVFGTVGIVAVYIDDIAFFNSHARIYGLTIFL